MKDVSIKNYALFEVHDESTRAVFCGGRQDWYRKRRQRFSGCGPTVASALIGYMSRSGGGERPETWTKNRFMELMDDVWQDVTPGLRGIPTAARFKRGIEAYCARRNLPFSAQELDIPRDRPARPGLLELLRFVSRALEDDAPVAFLNLDRGAEELLETWHWVILLSLRYKEDGSSATAEIADEGQLRRIDLKRWYDTTARGGGFVALRRADR